MKIAFVGSHCVGKTTALWYTGAMLKQAGYNSVEILPELARVCPFPINQEANFNTCLWLLFEQIKMEWLTNNSLSHGRPMIVLQDRSVIDEYAYAATQFPDKKRFVQKIIEAWMKIQPYDGLLYFPIEWDIIDDNVRDTDVQWQKKVDSTLWAYLIVHHSSEFVQLNGKNHTERSKNAFEAVKRIVKNESKRISA